MANPYETSRIGADVNLLPKHVFVFTAASCAGFAITLFLLSLAAWILNQELQYVPTETTYHLSAVGDIPLTNYHLVAALIFMSAMIGLMSFALLRIACSNRKHNSFVSPGQ